MSRTGVIESSMPEADEVLEGPQNESERTAEAIAAARWFREGVAVYEGQKQAAADIGVDPAYLRRQCAGAKPVNLMHLERIRRLRAPAFRRIIESMAVDAQMVIIASADLSLTGEQRAILLTTRDLMGPKMWPAYRDQLAARVFRCGGDVLDHALEYETERK